MCPCARVLMPMKISAFTIVRNAVKFNYPVVESIRSILPFCDEFIINVGDSEDETLKLIESLHDPKIRIIRNKWNFSLGKEVLSYQTNLALKECRGDWAFYLQSDEVIHENDLPRLSILLRRYTHDKTIDALRFYWFHFYGSYYRYRVDQGWYQKQDRIIRNNGSIQSVGDAYSFERKDKKELKRLNTGCFVYHYGWVHNEKVMAQRLENATRIGFASRFDEVHQGSAYDFGDLSRFPIYFGTHPKVMKDRVAQHNISQRDWHQIKAQYWWHPLKILKVRLKTGKRLRERIS